MLNFSFVISGAHNRIWSSVIGRLLLKCTLGIIVDFSFYVHRLWFLIKEPERKFHVHPRLEERKLSVTNMIYESMNQTFTSRTLFAWNSSSCHDLTCCHQAWENVLLLFGWAVPLIKTLWLVCIKSSVSVWSPAHDLIGPPEVMSLWCQGLRLDALWHHFLQNHRNFGLKWQSGCSRPCTRLCVCVCECVLCVDGCVCVCGCV